MSIKYETNIFGTVNKLTVHLFVCFLYFTNLLIKRVDLTIVHIMKAVEAIKAVAQSSLDMTLCGGK